MLFSCGGHPLQILTLQLIQSSLSRFLHVPGLSENICTTGACLCEMSSSFSSTEDVTVIFLAGRQA